MIPEAVAKVLLTKMEPEENQTGNASATVGMILKDNLTWILNSELFTEEQRKAACLMASCKTPSMGTYVEYCPECERSWEFTIVPATTEIAQTVNILFRKNG